MNENKPVKHGALWTVLFAVVSLFWIFPIVLVLINSFKQKAYISKNAFSLPAGKAFVGLENYVRGIETTQFFASFGWTLLITVGSVALILVCTAMCAWWIVRVNNWAAKLLYTLFLFNMIVPFQMVMFKHLDAAQREAQRGECGRHEIGVVPDADRMPGDLAVGEVAGQTYVRP